MKKFDKTWLRIQAALLVVGILNIIWVIVKSVNLRMQIFGDIQTGTEIIIAAVVAIFLIQFSVRDFISYKKNNKIKHGYDERNIKVLVNSFNNTGLFFIVSLYLMILYYSLFYEATDKIFSIRTFFWIFLVGAFIFMFSFSYYSKSKRL
jgi:hypothetical protein